ncbi:MAG: hypothetical protein ABJA10_06135 [Aestuariivirga sp.]
MDNYEKWKHAYETELHQRTQLYRILSSESGSQPSAAALREWWRSVDNVLKVFVLQAAKGDMPNPLPLDLLRVISGFTGSFASGKIPDPIRHSVSEGNPAAGPNERRQIGLAVAYKQAAEGKLFHNGVAISIPDKTSTKTLCKLFGVKESTVRGWKKRYEPAFLGINDITAGIFVKLVKAAGRQYRQSGRSHKAIARRNRPPRN